MREVGQGREAAEAGMGLFKDTGTFGVQKDVGPHSSGLGRVWIDNEQDGDVSRTWPVLWGGEISRGGTGCMKQGSRRKNGQA